MFLNNQRITFQKVFKTINLIAYTGESMPRRAKKAKRNVKKHDTINLGNIKRRIIEIKVKSGGRTKIVRMDMGNAISIEPYQQKVGDWVTRSSIIVSRQDGTAHAIPVSKIPDSVKGMFLTHSRHGIILKANGIHHIIRGNKEEVLSVGDTTKLQIGKKYLIGMGGTPANIGGMYPGIEIRILERSARRVDNSIKAKISAHKDKIKKALFK